MITLVSFAGLLNAQVTTSGMSGKVIDATGMEVIGANVVALHEPSGTTYGAVTNVDGRFNIHGMRTGGPYKLTVTYIGYADAITTGIFLELGNTFSKNVTLKEDSELLGEVVVTGESKATSGSGQNFSTERIASTPTVDRSVYDIVKNSPLAGPSKGNGLSFAGTNNRYNSFQIDGTVSNDVFGLSGDGTNGGQTGANPVSMEAVQEIQVVVAPFDVRQGGFTGGGINAVTKQGNNKFTASAYTFYNNENFWGRYSAINDYEESRMPEQNTKTFGASIAGPIVKDKLFYFVNVESKTDLSPSPFYAGVNDSYLSKDVAQQIADKYADLTGNQETFAQRDKGQDQLSAIARLDWNINQANKLSVRYQHSTSSKDNYSPSNTKYIFENSGFQYSNATNSVVAELTSRISDNLHNEFRASASFVRDSRSLPYQGPSVEIQNVPAPDGTQMYINIGTEKNSGANSLNQDVYTVENNISWYKGNHTLTFGTHNEFYRMNNVFVQSANGFWSYDGLEAFLNNTPSKFEFKYMDPEKTGGNKQWSPTMRFAQVGVYAQDKWDPTNLFSLTYGLRLDMPMTLESPTTNEEFNQFVKEQGIDARVGDKPTAKIMVSPRLGFRWFTNESRKTLVRGGVGIFTGRAPFVWLSNAFTNTGVEQLGTTINTDAPQLGNYTQDQLIDLASKGSSARPDIVTVSKDFKFPQILRGNLALEQRLPGDIKMTLEGVYSKTMNNVQFTNLALKQDGYVYAIPGNESTKIPYYVNNSGKYNSIVHLENTSKGYSYVLSALLEKSFDFGLYMSGSYTYGRSMSVNDGTSSIAYSNWKGHFSKDPNSANELSFSKFDVPHKVMLSLNYTTPRYARGRMQTTVGLIYNGYSGSRYSLSMREGYSGDSFNGDRYAGNTLLYIPNELEMEKMNFATPEDKDLFAAWIEQDDYASKNRGQYAERNSKIAPWENRVDLHIAQDIFYLKERGSKVQLTFDVMNFGNMLNKKWGASYSAPYTLNPLYVSVDADRTPTYSYNKTPEVNYNDIFSRWQAQVGVKVTF